MLNISSDYVKTKIPKRPNDSYKGTFGHTLIFAGQKQMAGAMLLASKACVYAGSGLTTVITDEDNRLALNTQVPEAMFAGFDDIDHIKLLISKATTLLIGPGLGLSSQAMELLAMCLKLAEAKHTLIIDGDALTLYAKLENKETKATVVLTPHLGEWARICKVSVAEIKDSRFDYQFNIAKAKELDCIVVLKSEKTHIYDGITGDYYANIEGNPGMSIGGMGDTLAGIIAGINGQCQAVIDTATIGSFLHSDIANEIYKNDYIVLPTRLIEAIPRKMATLFL